MSTRGATTSYQPGGLRLVTGLRWMLSAWGVALLLVAGARWVGGVAFAQGTVLVVAGLPWQGRAGSGLVSIQSPELFLVDVDRGFDTRLDLRLISPVPPTYDRLAWSADNRWLAYVASEPDIFPELPGLLLDGLFIMDLTTLQARLYVPEIAWESDLAWAPRRAANGARLVVAARGTGTQATDVFLVDAERRDVRNLSADPGRDVWPQWMADGRTVIFLSDRDGNWEIYAADVASGALRNLTQHPAQDRALDGSGAIPADPNSQMAASPVGTEVAFVSNRDSAGDIFAVDVASGATRLLAAVDGEIRDVSWSPSGRWLTFGTRQTFGRGLDPDEVYVVDVTTGALTNVSQRPEAEDRRPIWAGSDRWLIFNSDRAADATWGIYAADLVNGDVHPLSAASTAPDAASNDFLYAATGLTGSAGWLPFYSTRQAGRLYVIYAGSGEVRALDFHSQIFAGWNP